MRKTIYVDNTLLSSLACSTRAILRHHHGLTGDGSQSQARLRAGTAGHAALEAWFRGESRAAALAAFEREYRAWSDENLALESPVAFENVNEILGAWLTDHPRESLPIVCKPDNIEVGFQLPLSITCVCGHAEARHRNGGVCGVTGARDSRDSVVACSCTRYAPEFVFCGRLDAWGEARDGSGELWALDHKLTGWLNDEYMASYRLAAQMRGYVWALQQTLGRPVAGFIVNGIQAFRRLPYDFGRRCAKHQVKYGECRLLHVVAELRPFRVTQAELKTWHANALALARRYRELCERYPNMASDLAAVPMEGTFTRACKWCEFAEFCEAGRPVEWASSVLRYDPWRPFPDDEAASDKT